MTSGDGDSKHLSPLSIPRMFGDVPPFMGVDHTPSLAGVTADAVVVGMPYDGIATFRGGATRRAPQEIRKYSLLFGGYNFDWDMDAWDHVRVTDAGDIDVVPGNAAESYDRLERRIDEITGIGAIPLTIGGDHGISYPAVRAVARVRGGPMGLILFDTHLYLSETFREDRLTRASPVRRICELPEIDPRRIAIIGARGPRNIAEWTPQAKELGIRVYKMAEVEARGIHEVVTEARQIASPDGTPPYISVDIDGIDPAYAPATNSLEPGGFTSREIITGVRLAAQGGFTGFDVVEVSPDFDNPTGTTSVLAARLFVEAICSLAADRAGLGPTWRYHPSS